MQARKRGRVPDASYDFDGDGVVGQLDYFVGRTFDKDMDGKLSVSERRAAEKALDAGFLDGYARGFDAQGSRMRPYALQQRCGSILTLDNTAEVSCSIYPQHPNSHVVPKHETKTAMQLSRTGEAKQAGMEVGEKYMSKMAPVPLPAPPNHETHPRVLPFSHISQAAEADHQAARVRAGLLPMSSAVNLERELKTNGMAYVESPLFQTRSQLLETRKELMKHQCEELAVKGEDAMTPRSVRSSRAKAEEFDFRRANADSMTLTKLKDQRRVARREYDMQHFKLNRNPLEYPKFADNPEVPFWLAGREESTASTAPPLRLFASASEPVLKVTEVPFNEEVPGAVTMQVHQERTAVATRKPTRKTDMGAKTVQRFSVQMTENGEGRNKPRLFDSIQPVEVNVRDFEPLDATSCMEPIRKKCIQDMKSQSKMNAERPMRSKMYDATRAQYGTGRGRMRGGMTETDGHQSAGMTGMGSQAPMDSTNYDPGARYRSERQGRNLQTVLHGGSMDAVAQPRGFGRNTGGVGVRSGGFQAFEHSTAIGASSLGALSPGKRTHLAPSQMVAPPPPALPLQH
jgi:hypothetical protein